MSMSNDKVEELVAASQTADEMQMLWRYSQKQMTECQETLGMILEGHDEPDDENGSIIESYFGSKVERRELDPDEQTLTRQHRIAELRRQIESYQRDVAYYRRRLAEERVAAFPN